MSVGAGFNILNIVICVSICYKGGALTMLMYKNEHDW